ncbi:MAG: hypothetical protein OXG59_03875 [Gammaproteobacteria bacterium]|nr:hypothetical protein [Gammaproteobacteria bacterium]MYH32792.1 hypothetical protein [Gammaproteobacteria bacterium]
MANWRSRAAAAAALLLLVSLAASAQQRSAGGLDAMLAEPFPHMPEALGPFSHKISSDNPQAQAFFDQGLQFRYAFAKYEAVRSFREAQKADPECAICYWGEAWAWGSYLNVHMREREAPYAYAAISRARDLRGKASPREQAYIDALSVRYVADYDYEDRRVQDRAYADAAQLLAEQYPDDPDAATLYAEALFLLEPRRGYRDLEDPDVKRIHAVLEGVLARDIRHPGACHLYIHATESTARPEVAEPCAEHIGNAIPGASHINHMPSHTFNEVGRWGDSVRASIQAWHTDLKAKASLGVSTYPTHNLQMLSFAASYDGQGAVALRAAKDYAKLTRRKSLQLLTLVRFGRFDEIAEAGDRPRRDYAAGVWDFAQGYASVRLGEPDTGRAHLARLRELAETTDARAHFEPASVLLGVLAEILAGEVSRKDGNLDAAIDAFERAAEHEGKLDFNEPEPLPFAARHWLGAALLEAGRHAEAERVYRDDLAEHPRNGWSLFGLREALAAQGKPDPAVQREFERAWARSDTWINASRF